MSELLNSLWKKKKEKKKTLTPRFWSLASSLSFWISRTEANPTRYLWLNIKAFDELLQGVNLKYTHFETLLIKLLTNAKFVLDFDLQLHSHWPKPDSLGSTGAYYVEQFDFPFSVQEVEKSITCLKPDKSGGNDLLTPQIFIESKTILSPCYAIC